MHVRQKPDDQRSANILTTAAAVKEAFSMVVNPCRCMQTHYTLPWQRVFENAELLRMRRDVEQLLGIAVIELVSLLV
jgi:hypothetical protein